MIDISFFYAAVLISLAGGVGAVIRLYLAQWIGTLPWGILLANLIGSLIVGLLSSNGNIMLATILITGFAGGLSTFSAFIAQTADFMRSHRLAQGFWNILANLLLSSTAVLLGQSIAAALLK